VKSLNESTLVLVITWVVIVTAGYLLSSAGSPVSAAPAPPGCGNCAFCEKFATFQVFGGDRGFTTVTDITQPTPSAFAGGPDLYKSPSCNESGLVVGRRASRFTRKHRRARGRPSARSAWWHD
jgi:hypothetical protein